VRIVVSICAAHVTHFFKDKTPISNGAIHWQSDTVLSVNEQLGQKKVKIAEYWKTELTFLSRFWQAWTHLHFVLVKNKMQV